MGQQRQPDWGAADHQPAVRTKKANNTSSDYRYTAGSAGSVASAASAAPVVIFNCMSKRQGTFPLKISYEVGVLALIAFVISVASLGWQILNYMKGAEVRLIPPDQIVIGSSESVNFPSRDDGTYVHFIVPMSYVNEGAAGYNATIQRERIRIKIDGHPGFELRWFRFVTLDATGPSATKLIVAKVSDARPLPLPAGTAKSHTTLFQPWEKECPTSGLQCNKRENYVPWKTFIDLLRTKHVIQLEIMADTYGSENPISVKCNVNMPPRAFATLVTNGWGSPICK